MALEPFDFAGFTFPRKIPEFRRSTHNTRTLSNGRTVPARMRFAYSTTPHPLSPGGSFGYYLESDFAPDLRWTWCDKVEDSYIRHEGWFTDEFQDSTIRGLVLRLPKGRGFLAGHAMGEGMGATAERQIYESEREAARAADRLAERVAEEERDYHEGFAAGDRATQAGEESADARGRALALLADVKRARRNLAGEAGALVCAALSASVAELVDTWRDKRAERDKLRRDWRGHAGFAESHGEG